MLRALTLFLLLLAAPAWADDARADDPRLHDLFARLEAADEASYQPIEDQIWSIWSESGSPAMDALLARGEKAIEADEALAAVEHLTALVENAPDFAEGWYMRATAFYRSGAPGLAVADLARVLALEPRHFGAFAVLGTILEETGDTEGALKAYEAAVAIHPFRPELREAVERLQAGLEGKAI